MKERSLNSEREREVTARVEREREKEESGTKRGSSRRRNGT